MGTPPPLPPLSPAQRAAWWGALKDLARADGDLTKKERAALESWARRLDVEPDLADVKRAVPARLARVFRDERLREAAFRSLTDLATCDGDYAEEEDRWLEALALAWWPPDPDPLGRLTAAQARALWIGLCAIAFCDGHVAGAERHVLANWRKRLEVPDRPDRAPGAGLDDLASAFQTDDQRTAVCELLLELATCDGDLKPEEREVLDDLTRRWRLPFPR